MRITNRTTWIVMCVAICVVLTSAINVMAGSLDSPGTPPATSSYTMEDIYSRLDIGTAGIPGAFAEPAAGPTAGTMHTLGDIMGKAPVADANGASTGDVLAGKTFWGLTSGGWGPRTGALSTRTLSADSVTVAAGYYAATTLSAVDTNLATVNIRSGVNIFGVTGKPEVVDTTSGTAGALDMLAGKTAYVAGSAVTGTMVNRGAVSFTPGTYSQSIPDGYHNGSGTVAGDTGLVTDNIRSGVTIFGVAGDTNVVNTSSGDALASDLKLGKKAWVKGTQLTGNLAGGVPCTCPGGTSPLGRWCDNGNGTVTDTTTGLIWLKNAEWGGIKPWRADSGYDDAHTRAGLLSAADGTAGLSDGSVVGAWRLPTMADLVTLTTGTEAIRSSFIYNSSTSVYKFTGVKSAYWSSTTFAFGTDRAFDVFLPDGGVDAPPKAATCYVWPVRGGQ
jgi:hypothetical protein